ncbi:Rap1a/Tai family immunity protein [Roseococcus sp. YIM B11640]|uniref:Rap1a/Tai family immunity protein n=1 Tax=Roseococcus sp. YIM B11640 TaxID=3133973 RepID=UPI003C7A61C1
MRFLAVAGALVALAGPALAQSANPSVDPSAFQGRTAGDLAALCGATQDDPRYVAAVHFCHGFLQGAAQYHNATRRAGTRTPPLFCPPEQRPSVEQVASSYVTWLRGSPQYAGEAAVDGLTRWAQATYPCPATPPRRRR